MKQVFTGEFEKFDEKSKEFIKEWVKKLAPVLDSSAQKKLGAYAIKAYYFGEDYKEKIKEDMEFFKKMFNDYGVNNSKELMKKVVKRYGATAMDLFPQAIILDWHKTDEKTLVFIILSISIPEGVELTFYNPDAAVSMVYIGEKS